MLIHGDSSWEVWYFIFQLGSLSRQWRNQRSALEPSLAGRGRITRRETCAIGFLSLRAALVALAADLSGKVFFCLAKIKLFVWWYRGYTYHSWKHERTERSVPAPGLNQAPGIWAGGSGCVNTLTTRSLPVSQENILLVSLTVVRKLKPDLRKVCGRRPHLLIGKLHVQVEAPWSTPPPQKCLSKWFLIAFTPLRCVFCSGCWSTRGSTVTAVAVVRSTPLQNPGQMSKALVFCSGMSSGWKKRSVHEEKTLSHAVPLPFNALGWEGTYWSRTQTIYLKRQLVSSCFCISWNRL